MRPRGRFYKDITLIALAELIWFLGFSMYINFFPLQIRQLGGNDYIVSLLSFIPLFLGILAIVGGVLSDIIDRKKILLFGWVITIPAPLIWAFADRWEWLLVGQIIYAMTIISASTVTIYIFDYESPVNKMLGYSLIIICGTLGSILGPFIGGKIMGSYGFQTLYFILAALYFISTLCLIPISSQRAKSKVRLSQYLKWNHIIGTYSLKRLIIITFFLSALSLFQNIAEPYLPLYLNEYKKFSVDQIGIVFTFLSIGAALFTWFYGKTSGKVIIHYAILAGILIFIFSISLVLFSTNDFLLFIAFFLRGVNKALIAFIQGYVAYSLAGENKGVILSFFITVRSLFIGIAAFPGAFLYHMNPLAPFYAEAVFMILWILVSFHYYFRRNWQESSPFQPHV